MISIVGVVCRRTVLLYIVEKYHLLSLVGKVDGRVSSITYYILLENRNPSVTS